MPLNESDVEQKLIFPLLSGPEPEGLGYSKSDIRTKTDLRRFSIDKGNSKKLHVPDYAMILGGIPVVIVEVKNQSEKIDDAYREARLYAHETNALYGRKLNPCERIIASNGLQIYAGYWDQSEPSLSCSLDDLVSISEQYEKLLEIAGKTSALKIADAFLSEIRTNARFFKPVQMLGGKTISSEPVSDNSFGSNISLEYRHLFNPNSARERRDVVQNAYVTSKKKLSHVDPIDRVVRAAVPPHVQDAQRILDTSNPERLTSRIEERAVVNELILLIGGVGTGKSTFIDYLRLSALPENLRSKTTWFSINLNNAPPSADLLFSWVTRQLIDAISAEHVDRDIGSLKTLQDIFHAEVEAVKRGPASLFSEDSYEFKKALHDRLVELQKDVPRYLEALLKYFYSSRGTLAIVVLDNCDKRTRDQQLLMFDLASWLKDSYPCVVFLPLRDTTYDHYREQPPLDTVIKDLVFRIDPPLLERVIYARLNYAQRELVLDQSAFSYNLSNGIRVECARTEVSAYIQSIVSSLFQNRFFKRVIVGLAGRNIRKGLEIVLDFCKSGHISDSDIFRLRASNGDYSLPAHLVSRILLKGRRRYYFDSEARVKNLFHSDPRDVLPNPFTRIAILNWLRARRREYGPNRTLGYHSVEELSKDLQSSGFSSETIYRELHELVSADCVFSESQEAEIFDNDLISIAPSGHVHLEISRSLSYLATVAEDVWYRENQPAKLIADNLTGRGVFRPNSKRSDLSTSQALLRYLNRYSSMISPTTPRIINFEQDLVRSQLDALVNYVGSQAEKDNEFVKIQNLSASYPPGTEVEGRVVSVQNYGIFIEFDLEGNGFVHKSQFNGFNSDPRSPIESGDWVTVEVVNFNSKHKRFELKLLARS